MVVLAHREFEAWFLAAIESLRGTGGIRADAESHHDPESPREQKANWNGGWSRGVAIPRRGINPHSQRYLTLGRPKLSLLPPHGKGVFRVSRCSGRDAPHPRPPADWLEAEA